MHMIRSWKFVNTSAALSGAAAFGLLTTPAKLQAEPNMFGIMSLPVIVAAGVWLTAAMLRYWLRR